MRTARPTWSTSRPAMDLFARRARSRSGGRSTAGSTSRFSRRWRPGIAWSFLGRSCSMAPPSSCSGPACLRISSSSASRRLAAVLVTLGIAAYGVTRLPRDTPIEASPTSPTAGHRHRPGARPRPRGNRAPDHAAARTRAQRHAGHDLDAQREPVRLSLVTLTFDDDVDRSSRAQCVTERLADADLPDGITPSSRPKRRRSARSTSSRS